MTFRMIAEGNRHRVELDREPNWVHGLATGDGLDAAGSGPALVVAFSIWSTPDREDAYAAVDVGKDEGFSIPVYLLPFDYPEELSSWSAELSSSPGEVIIGVVSTQSTTEVSLSPNAGSTPVWMLVHGGRVVKTRQGRLSAVEIRSLLEATMQLE